MEIKSKHIFFVLILVALAGMIKYNEITGQAYYRDYGGYGYGLGLFDFGFVNFSDLYYQYGTLIDAIIFLLIFLGLGRSIFGEKFKGAGGTAVYTGLGLFLTFALLLFEEQTGFNLLYSFGPVVMFMFAAVIFIYGYKLLKEHAGIGLIPAAAIMYLVLWLLLIKTGAGRKLIDWFFSAFGFVFDVNKFDILAFIAVVALIAYGIFSFFTRKKKSP
ncbi:MAG: hypothetical protein AABY07_09730 [Nanoarchaeota archaeon]